MRTLLILVALTSNLVIAAPPRVTHEALKLSQLADSTQLKHPTAIDVGPDGKLYVIESHTHFPPKGYDGPKADRILVFDPRKPDAPLAVFYDKTDKTMGMAWAPEGSGAEGWLYLVGRSEVTRVRDDDGDGRAERAERVLHLDTTQKYPHNALSGIAFSPDGKTLYLGCGENMGIDYTFVGADGSGFKVTDGSGNIVTCTVDGTKVQRHATGFWNPFGLAFHGNGELFATENDPDSSPPCRLLHVVPGGDYGFRFMYGRSGRHPLLAWNGELPGTLGMVSGTGESPCEIVHFRGHLIVASWADHRIEMYTLKPKGGTYTATMRTLVEGGPDFRPVGLALSPDKKSLYISDWVDRSYTLHGKGRLWRLDGIHNAIETTTTDAPPTWEKGDPLDDPFTRTRVVAELARDVPLSGRAPNADIANLHAYRLAGSNEARLIEKAIESDDPRIRLFTVRWIADERLKQFRPLLDKVFADEKVMTPQLFACTVAAMQWLDTGKTTPGNGAAPPRPLLDMLRGEKSTDTQRLMALRALGRYDTRIDLDLLHRFIRDGSPELRLAAVRAIAASTNDEKLKPLVMIADDPRQRGDVRAEAIVGFAHRIDTFQGKIEQLKKDKDPIVAAEAKRALRNEPPADRPAPNDIDAWLKIAEGVGREGDPKVGRRLFFHPKLTTCASCHTIDGHGGKAGPDLSLVGRRATKRWLLESILEPSKEIPPYYRPWEVTMKDGATHIGILRATGGQGGNQPYFDATGNAFSLKSNDVADRKLQEISIMPPALIGMLTDQEVRDLLAYLMSRE